MALRPRREAGRPAGGGGGRGAAPPFPRGAAGRPYCGAVCGGGGASRLWRPSASHRLLSLPTAAATPGAAAQRTGSARGGKEPLALRVSRRRPPFPHPLLPGGAGDAEVAARSCGGPRGPAAAPRGPRAPFRSRPAGRGAAALTARRARPPPGPARAAGRGPKPPRRVAGPPSGWALEPPSPGGAAASRCLGAVPRARPFSVL